MARIYHPERLDGLRPELRAFVSWWASNGKFPLVVAKDGGLRTDSNAQLGLFLAGRSKAKTLAETPHGRGAAVDMWPARVTSTGVVTGIYLPDAPESRVEAVSRLTLYGHAAEACGLAWGGRWLPVDSETGLGWDAAHVEVPDWKSLPYPPQENTQ